MRGRMHPRCGEAWATDTGVSQHIAGAATSERADSVPPPSPPQPAAAPAAATAHANVRRSLWMAFRLLLAMIGGTDGGDLTWENGLRVLKGATPFATANCPTWARARAATP